MTQARTTAFILDHTISSALLFQLENKSAGSRNNERIGPVLDGLAELFSVSVHHRISVDRGAPAGSFVHHHDIVEIEMRLLRTKDRPF